MLWLKSLHIIFLVSWFAGLFYLPRLFVYHAMATDAIGIERFKVMERKLYYGIMAPSAVLTIVSGMWLWLGYGFYRWINEIPALPVLVAIVLLVVFKPF
ncbi:MAG: TIGR00701 family protein [Betaproteobacteria bacterium]|nr:MAG: TIGR00701 family protein [Betaproteobacteria bacterium]